METAGRIPDDRRMELVTNIGAVLAGAVMVIVGAYAIAVILFDDLS